MHQRHGRRNVINEEDTLLLPVLDDAAQYCFNCHDMLTNFGQRLTREHRVQLRPEAEVEFLGRAQMFRDVDPHRVSWPIRGFKRCGEAIQITIGLLARECHDHRVLVGEMVVDRGTPDARFGGKVGHRHGIEGLLREQCDQPVEDPTTGLLAVLLERATNNLGHCRNVRQVSTTDLARQAADALRERTGGGEHDIALVMGSGWLPAADALGAPDYEVPLAELPGFSAPAVAGHGGTVRSVTLGDKRLLIFLGRTHFYEGKGVAAVVHGVRTAAAAGVKTLVLTNGCGGLNPDWSPGTPVLISDHINMTATSPLEGATFVDLTDLYSSRLRALCKEADPSLDEGVYVQLPGPHYETPAEIRMIRTIGGDLVGMSTTLEAIAARAAGLEVLGISLVTNAAAGMTGEPLNHEEVLEAGKSAATRMGTLLGSILPRI